MAAKIPVRAVFDGSTATGLSEFQSTEFIALAYGGLGASLSIGSAGQVLKVNAGADALEFGAVEAVLNIDGMTDGSGITIADGDTLTVTAADGTAIVFTAKASGASAPQFNIVAGNSNSTADNLKIVIEAQAKLRATVINNVVTISQETAGTSGNTKTCQSSDTGAMFKPGASTTQPDNFAGGVNRDIALASNAAASSSVVLGILDAASTSGNPALVLGGESMVKSSNYTFNDVDLGAKVYLGTSGQLTTTAPTAAGTYVVECGIIFDNDTVLFRPVFIMENG